MKIYKASIQVSIFFVLQLNHSLSQSNFEIGFSADIYNIPISNLTLDLGTMERMAKPIFKLNEASYVDFIWWRKNNFGWFVGLGLHTYNYEARIKIPDPFDPSFPLLDEIRSIRTVGWGARIGGVKQFKNTRISFSMVAFNPFVYNESHSAETLTYVFIDDSNNYYYLRTIEYINTVDDIGNYLMWQISAEQKISNNLFFKFGLESTISAPRYHYNLRVIEFFEGSNQYGNLLNDFFITASYRAISLGLSYKIPLSNEK